LFQNDYLNLLEYSKKKDLNNLKINQLPNKEIITEEYQSKNTNNKKINENNTIIINIFNIPLILQNYFRNIPKYNISKISDNNKSEFYITF
jgi:hypothetical protein